MPESGVAHGRDCRQHAIISQGRCPWLAGGRKTSAARHRKDKTNPNRIGGEFNSMAEVIIQESESLENALRRFKRKVQQEDIIKEIKKHSFYMKPGEKRRAKEALSRKRLRKKQRREAD
jgi:small subunit ribosomal protein S21